MATTDGTATLVLVRHATTPATGRRLGGWTPGVDLDEAGVSQAQATAARLQDVPVRAVYASPLERTQQTARILARPHRLRVRTRQGLGEIDYGRWTDQPLGRLRRRALWRVVQHTPSRVTFPGGESIRQAQARAVDLTEELAAAHRGEVIVCVTHADVIKAVVAHHLAMPLDAFQRLVVDPASATALQLPAEGPPSLRCFNDVGGIAATLPWRTAETASGGGAPT